MNPPPKPAHLGSLLLLIAAVGASLSVAGTSTRPGNLACVSNAASLSLAVDEYVQDWDETFPPTKTTTAFQAAVLPYTPSHSVFVCPVTGVNYKPNALLNNVSLPSLGQDAGSIEVIRDGQPHADGLPTIGYADGHVERNGVNETDPEQVCLSDARQIALGLEQYIQDNDEVLPPMHTPAEMQDAIFPT